MAQELEMSLKEHCALPLVPSFPKLGRRDRKGAVLKRLVSRVERWIITTNLPFVNPELC